MSSTTKNAVSDKPSRRQEVAETRDQQFGRYFGTQLEIMDDLDLFVSVLPPAIREVLESQPDLKELFEVVLDLGRPPEARFASRVMDLSDEPVTQAQIDQVVARVGDFGKDNRAGIERTLHRISAIRNRQGRIIGLTCRVGRAVFGTIDIIRDVVESGKSFLLLGRPGVGKTTKLREVARILSDEFQKRVVIVDTSNEIGGDGDVPHPAIGRSRRMQVTTPEDQHAVMIEAVENHMPEVIIIDEIGVEAEAFAARTIAERGVQLVGTAHGNSLENLLSNPTLSDLIGGIQAVTLSDEEARRRGTQKTVLERKAPPTFDVLIEILEMDKLAIHHDVATVVDQFLRGIAPRPEIRIRNPQGDVEVIQKSDSAPVHREPLAEEEQEPLAGKRIQGTVRIFPYGVSRNRLERAIREMRVPAHITNDYQEADAVITLKSHFRRIPPRLKEAQRQTLGTFVVKSNTYTQIAGTIREMFALASDDVEAVALREAREAIERVLESSEPVELMPQSSYVRRLQHQLAEQYELASTSIGTEPFRRVRISKP
jgi:stage III sporulation protein SpoIIIAA